MKAIPKLELYLLGSPQIYVAGQAVTGFNTRKDQALLAYLAVTGLAHSRETLAGLLWSELPEANARRNLRHSLSHLQKVIGAQWLTLARGVALTQAQPWSVDVHTLRTAVKSVTRAAGETRPHPPEGIATLQQVLPLYRGEFLQGFYLHQAVHFEEWVLAQREEVRLLTLRGLEVLVEHSLAQGAYEVGLTATRRLLQLEPWSEAAHSWQMQLLARSGRRAEALAQYERCRHVLATDLGVAPLPATTALYLQLQRGHDPWADAAPPATPPGPPTVLPPPGNAPGTGHPNPPHNLLAPLAAFVGRQTELAFIDQRLLAADCRLLTIVGPGGMGKTSLAQAAAQRILQATQADFPDGIYFVALSGLEPEKDVETNEADRGQAGTLMATAIAERIGCDLQSELPAQVQLQNYLRHRRLLLILDNFEQLLAATDTVLTLLTQAPALTMLITSRARLNLDEETVLTLAKLSLPATGTATDEQAHRSLTNSNERWQASDAVAMFVQRAQCLDSYFTLNATNLDEVMRICHLVDGLPLGIELATSMLSLLSCTELAEALTQNLAFLQTEMYDLPAHQRTLRAVFERSWRLLAPQEQTLLTKLSLFPGTFHGAAAQAIADASQPLLLRLINQSLLNIMPDGRYAIHRSVREFALEKLQQAPDQGDTLRIAYARFYLNFLAQKEPALNGAALTTVNAQIYTELDNIRVAWRWAVSYRLPSALNACLQAFFLFYEQQGLFLEAFEQLGNALNHFLANDEAQANLADPPTHLLIGRLQTYFGWCNARLGRMQQADAAYKASITILQQADSPFAIILCLSLWGAMLRGIDVPRSKALLTEAMRQVQAIDDIWLNAIVYLFLGETNYLLGNYLDSEAQYSKGYALTQQLGWGWGIAASQRLLGRVKLALGQYRESEAYFRACIAQARPQNMQVIWIEGITSLGEALRLQGRLDEAHQCYITSRQPAEALQFKFLIAQVIWAQGSLAEQSGDYAAAKAFFAEGMATSHPNAWAHLPPTLGWALIGLGELDEAYRYFCNLVTEAQTRQLAPITLDAQVGLAYVQALRANARPARAEEKITTTEPVATVFQHVYHQPAATQETRTRITKLAAALGLPKLEATRLPCG